MGYCANMSGDICIARPFTKEETEEVNRIFCDYFEVDVYEHHGHSTVDLYYGLEKYHEEDEWEVLTAFTERFGNEILSGELRYVGEDDAHWRLIWKDGRWQEQDGEIVYRDDGVFYTDTWSKQDILTALEEEFQNAPQTDDFINEVMRRCRKDRSFMETVTKAGWLALYDKIREALREGGQACRQENS